AFRPRFSWVLRLLGRLRGSLARRFGRDAPRTVRGRATRHARLGDAHRAYPAAHLEIGPGTGGARRDAPARPYAPPLQIGQLPSRPVRHNTHPREWHEPVVLGPERVRRRIAR